MVPNSDGLVALIEMGVVAIAIAVPLAVWKLVDIAIWLSHHVHLS